MNRLLSDFAPRDHNSFLDLVNEGVSRCFKVFANLNELIGNVCAVSWWAIRLSRGSVNLSLGFVWLLVVRCTFVVVSWS